MMSLQTSAPLSAPRKQPRANNQQQSSPLKTVSPAIVASLGMPAAKTLDSVIQLCNT